MKTKEILKNIKDNGGFHNFNKWNKKEIIQYIMSSYSCSNYVARKVSTLI